MTRYSLNNQLRIAARWEYYVDKQGVIIDTKTPNGFQTYGYSLNLDYLPAEHAMLRIEGRELISIEKIFRLTDQASNQNYFFSTSMILFF